MATRLLEIEATWDCGHVATWLGTLAVERLRVVRPLMRPLDDVLESYKLVTYIPRPVYNVPESVSRRKIHIYVSYYIGM